MLGIRTREVTAVPDEIEVQCRNAREEARARIGFAYEARVLEPSPPAVGPPEYADDPVARGEVPPGRRVISPVPTGDELWRELDADDPELAGFCMSRWLGPYKRLTSLPHEFHRTRDELHRLAAHVVYRTRRSATGRYGLRWTLGGFGTPFFGEDEQVRVDGDALVHQRAGACRAAPITTLREAASFAGVDLDPDFDHGFADVPPLGDPDAPLEVHAEAALVLSDWFGFAWSVLEEVRSLHTQASPSRPQLWPEHFDAALDLAFGEPSGEQRVSVGFSPGDEHHADPYLYVAPWTGDRPGDPIYWDAPFGAAVSHEDLVRAEDQREVAVHFIDHGLGLLREA